MWNLNYEFWLSTAQRRNDEWKESIEKKLSDKGVRTIVTANSGRNNRSLSFSQKTSFSYHSLCQIIEEGKTSYSFWMEMDSWFIYVEILYHSNQNGCWEKSRRENNPFFVCSVCSSQCEYMQIWNTAVTGFRWVIPGHSLISTSIRVPQCLKLEFQMVECVHLLFVTSSVHFPLLTITQRDLKQIP